MKVRKSHLRIALIILVAAVAFQLVMYFRSGVRPVAQAQPPQSPLIASAAPVAGGGEIDPLAIRAPQDVDLARVPGYPRDPFLFGDETREIVRAAATMPDLGPAPTVRSILFSSARRLAIVDGKIVGVGDQIGGYQVAEIEQGAVVFALSTGERRRVPVYGAATTGLIR